MSASRRFANSGVADLDAPHGVGGLEKGYGSIHLRCRRCGFHVIKHRSIDCIFRHCVTSPCHVTVRSNGKKAYVSWGFPSTRFRPRRDRASSARSKHTGGIRRFHANSG